MQNSRFGVNNPGTFGTIMSVPIINQPHAGILRMDTVLKRPVVYAREVDVYRIKSGGEMMGCNQIIMQQDAKRRLGWWTIVHHVIMA